MYIFFLVISYFIIVDFARVIQNKFFLVHVTYVLFERCLLSLLNTEIFAFFFVLKKIRNDKHDNLYVHFNMM